MQWDYFVSYSSEDRTAAGELIAALEAQGLRCFIDFRDIPPGSQRYRSHLAGAIKGSETVLVLVSPFSQASEEVLDEIQYGHDHGRRKIAVWLSGFQEYTNDTLQFLLAPVQHVDWTGGTAGDAARKVAATATLSRLHHQLAEYRSVTDQLRLDLEELFRKVDADDRVGAMAEVRDVSVALLRRLGREYGIESASANNLHSLVLACRDHIDQESLLRAFVEIDQRVTRSQFKVPNLDAITRAVEALMQALSVLLTLRWGLEFLDPCIRRNATFITGLLSEAGWLSGSELAPREDVLYLLFEKPVGAGKRYLELLISKDAEAAAAIAAESDGRILPAGGVPTATRFLVVDQPHPALNADLGQVITVDEFVLRFTGLEPVVRRAVAGPADRIVSDVRRAIAAGDRNVLVYGEPGTGKSRSLQTMIAEGWPDAPRFVFGVDFADATPESVHGHLNACIESAFPRSSRSHARGLASYLVRTGKAALIVDSIELAANAANPRAAARAFAGLCRYLSHESTVIFAGRDAALRDSAAVREFFLSAPSTSAQLAQVMSAIGVDGGSLPRFRMVRARAHAPVSVSTPHDRLDQALGGDAWLRDEQVAKRALATVIGDGRDLQQILMNAPTLERTQIGTLALGGTPGASDGLDVDAPWGLELGKTRQRREFRAALDFVRTALSHSPGTVWDRVQMGEAGRRYVRLLSLLGGSSPRRRYLLSLVGVPGAVMAIAHDGPVSLAPAPVTVGEYREFLGVVAGHPDPAARFACPDPSLLAPMYERLPRRFFEDDRYRDRPVTGISWWAARAYSSWRGCRLPTSLEWEIAGRSWDGRVFPWGDDPHSARIRCAETAAGRPLMDYAAWRLAMRNDEVAVANSRASSAADGNVSDLGHLDLVGNVWEWTDTHVGSYRAIAGGSYDNPLRACTLASRSCARADTFSNAVGFRMVVSG